MEQKVNFSEEVRKDVIDRVNKYLDNFDVGSVVPCIHIEHEVQTHIRFMVWEEVTKQFNKAIKDEVAKQKLVVDDLTKRQIESIVSRYKYWSETKEEQNEKQD
jgi:hypothetical protein